MRIYTVKIEHGINTYSVRTDGWAAVDEKSFGKNVCLQNTTTWTLSSEIQEKRMQKDKELKIRTAFTQTISKDSFTAPGGFIAERNTAGILTLRTNGKTKTLRKGILNHQKP